MPHLSPKDKYLQKADHKRYLDMWIEIQWEADYIANFAAQNITRGDARTEILAGWKTTQAAMDNLQNVLSLLKDAAQKVTAVGG